MKLTCPNVPIVPPGRTLSTRLQSVEALRRKRRPLWTHVSKWVMQSTWGWRLDSISGAWLITLSDGWRQYSWYKRRTERKMCFITGFNTLSSTVTQKCMSSSSSKCVEECVLRTQILQLEQPSWSDFIWCLHIQPDKKYHLLTGAKIESFTSAKKTKKQPCPCHVFAQLNMQVGVLWSLNVEITAESMQID